MTLKAQHHDDILQVLPGLLGVFRRIVYTDTCVPVELYTFPMLTGAHSTDIPHPPS